MHKNNNLEINYTIHVPSGQSYTRGNVIVADTYITNSSFLSTEEDVTRNKEKLMENLKNTAEWLDEVYFQDVYNNSKEIDDKLFIDSIIKIMNHDYPREYAETDKEVRIYRRMVFGLSLGLLDEAIPNEDKKVIRNNLKRIKNMLEMYNHSDKCVGTENQ